jgi:DNA-binding MarR family transcriptional regulator
MAKSGSVLSDADYRSLAEFRHLLRQFLAFSEEAAKAADLAPQQHQTLLAIKAAGAGITVGDLADRLVIQPHSAVGLIDRLVEGGLVKRSSGKSDRRHVQVSLTPAAEKSCSCSRNLIAKN